MKIQILQVRKRPKTGLGKKVQKLTGAIYLPPGNVGKRFAVIPSGQWKDWERGVQFNHKALGKIRKILIQIGYVI